jgi:FMN phosphatase YigB (HAD superfamily)
MALARLEAAPERAMHVGDSLESDCAPAEALGMTAVLLDRHGRHPDAPYRRISELNQLLTLVGLHEV